MKRKLIIIWILAFTFLSGCFQKGKAPEAVDGIVGKDTQNFWSNSNICKTEKGYYYLMNWKLYFFDQKTRQSGIVCNKPNCKHHTTECNGNMGNYGEVIQYQDGYLYSIGHDGKDVTNHYLYRISEDGSKKERLIRLFKIVKQVTEESRGYSYKFIVHRGYGYFSLDNYDTDKAAILYQVSIENSKELIPIYTSKNGERISKLEAFENCVYFVVCNDNNNEKIMYSYDIKNNKVSEIMKGLYSRYFIEDGILYYVKDNQILECELKTGKTSQIYKFEQEQNSSFSYDGVNFYLDNEPYVLTEDKNADRKITVISKEGKKLDEIQLEAKYMCYFGDQNYLFASNDIFASGESIVMKVYDKGQIGSRKAEWTSIMEDKQEEE